jgi:hypothetical protein
MWSIALMRGVPPPLVIRSRNVHDESMKVAIGLLALTLFGGCEAPLAGAPCPCLDGYVCDSARDVCIEFSDGGTTMDGAIPDAGFPESDGSGPVGDAATSEDGGSSTFDAGFDPDAGESDGGPTADGGAARNPAPR